MKTISTRILVIVENAGNKTNDLGLTLPDPLDSQGLEKASVLFVGEEIKGVSKEDTVYIYKGSGTKFTNPDDNKEYRVISLTDIVIIR